MVICATLRRIVAQMNALWYFKMAASNTLNAAANVSVAPYPFSLGKLPSFYPEIDSIRLIVHSIAPSPALLFYHFYKVAFYSIWVMFTHPRPVNNPKSEAKPMLAVPPVWEYPFLLIKSVKVVRCLRF